VEGVCLHRDAIDERLADASENWRVERMSPVDRNILRIALYEMFHRDDIPPRVSINEAIELAKRFGTEDSRAFVNGVLDRLYQMKQQEKQAEQVPPADRLG
jgi:N utilization substance protein B